jgi:hypothetical protein
MFRQFRVKLSHSFFLRPLNIEIVKVYLLSSSLIHVKELSIPNSFVFFSDYLLENKIFFRAYYLSSSYSS